MKRTSFTNETNQRWLLVINLIILGLPLLASSLYFLYYPSGYQGGRNPLYNQVVIFDRHDWDVIHLWSGLGMILFLIIHILLHWKWIKVMFNRCTRSTSDSQCRLNRHARINIYLDGIAALSFILAAISGIFLLYFPKGNVSITEPIFIFGKNQWDAIHTWSGVVMFISAFLHLSIHWGWVRQVGQRFIPKKQDLQKIEQGL